MDLTHHRTETIQVPREMSRERAKVIKICMPMCKFIYKYN